LVAADLDGGRDGRNNETMRILHTGDWHLGDRLQRIDRTADLRRGVERIAAYCDEHQVEVMIVAGDLFSELSRPDHLRDSIDHLRAVFTPFLARGGTIVAVTGNHDNEIFCRTLCSVMTLADPARAQPGATVPGGRFYLAFEPTLFRLADHTGQLVQFVLMPYPTPRYFLRENQQNYAGPEEKNHCLKVAYLRELRRYLEPGPNYDPGLPAVLVAHIHVDGAVLSNLQSLPASDGLCLSSSDVPGNLAYAALGHVHRPQCLQNLAHVRYSGSIDRLDLGERNDAKSVVIAEIGPKGLEGQPACLPLEATPIYEVAITRPQEDVPRLREQYPDADRALVRYHVTYRAGIDNLEAILRELDAVFPRWYDRDWTEAGELGPRRTDHEEPPSHRGFRDTVLTYLSTELADNPDRDALLKQAEGLLEAEST
jgi:exonuclease SbcD